VVTIGGRLGTLHEFTIAAETHTPIGVLESAGGVSAQIESLLKLLPNADSDLVVFEEDPEKLIAKLSRLLDKLNHHYLSLYEK
jgi:hypothetical protein